MYATSSHRRQGLATRTLTHLEETAAAAGAEWLVLETGTPQVEALALYAARGYGEVGAFGHYRCSPTAHHLGKRLRAD